MRQGGLHGVQRDGSGDAVNAHECEECEGTGTERWFTDEYSAHEEHFTVEHSKRCTACGGSGEIEDEIQEEEEASE